MSEPRAVTDTNCIISFYLNRTSHSRLAFAQLANDYQLLASEETCDEFKEVFLRHKFHRIPVSERLAAIAEYRSLVSLIRPHIIITACIDPKEDEFLSLAVSGNASLILAGDDHLLQLHPFRGIDILKPAQYLELTR